MELVVSNPLGASSTSSSVPEGELATSFLDAKDWTPAQVKQLQARMEARDEGQRVRLENTMARAAKDVAGWLTEAAPNWHHPRYRLPLRLHHLPRRLRRRIH